MLTGPEIEGIIQACARANVRSISVGGLHLEFGETTRKVAATEPKVAELTRAPVTTLTEEEHDEQNKETLELEELRLRQEQLDLMQIEDPLTAERLILSGELDALLEESE